MKKLFAIPIFIKNHLDYAVAAIILFLLLSPQAIWDEMYGRYRVDHPIFLVITVLFIIVCIGYFAEKKRHFSKGIRRNIWLILYAAALILAIITSTNPQLSLYLVPRCISSLFIVCIINMGEFTYKRTRRIFSIVMIGLLITAVYAILQFSQGIEPNKSFTDLTANPNMPGRVYSFFGNPNSYGFALAALLPISAAFTVGKESIFHRLLGAVSFILGCIALIMTYSRGAWFGLAVAMLVFVAVWRPKLLPVILVLGAAAFPFLPASIKDRILSIFNAKETSIGYRSLLVGSGMKLIADYPIFGAGVGLDTVQAVVLEKYWPTELAYRFTHAHNLYVQTWCEMGVFGFITFFGAIIQNVISAVQNFRQKSECVKLLTISLICGILAMLVCGITDYTLSYSRIMMLFWVLFGFLSAISKIEDENRHKS